MDFSNKKICILGLSKSGISAAKYLAQKASIIISEKRSATPEDSKIIKELEEIGIEIEMGGNKASTIEKSDLIITSPGIPPTAEVYKTIKKANIPTISEIDIAYLEAPQKTFIAITGTNGKTTTTKLTTEILQSAGLKATACGNIGTPPTSLLNEDVDYFVCEVSSFQIETSKYFTPEIACFLNYSPDHIDWHGDEEAYFEAKKSLFKKAKNCILNQNDKKVFEISKECKNTFPFGQNNVYIENNHLKIKDEVLLHTSELSLKGSHNLENIMASICIAKNLGIKNFVITNILKTFIPPEHRLEFVAEIENKKYYNDSKATNCDAAIKSIQAFQGESIALIAGGKDKGTDLDNFVTTIQENTNCVILIGEATERFESALKAVGYKNIDKAKNLEEAIDLAQIKDVQNILLAPACASFDMFKSFEDRGNVFKKYVLNKKNSK